MFAHMCLLPLFAGCFGPGQCPHVCRPVLPVAPSPVGVVFVANGSGDVRILSSNLRQVLADTCTPLQVETFIWSHGRGRVLADHTDYANMRAQGCRLAAQVGACRHQCPGCRIYLIGHSAGCAVVLAAAEMLPTESVDRIILLAPSVCADYDLRRALCTARCGIDVFCSHRDRLVLGLGMRLVGTADRRGRIAAGQRGFVPIIMWPTDAALYAKLREHPWGPDVTWTGNWGGHSGCNRASFLRAYVLPLLSSE
jgi:pimeloyl-ACP methyl ester carboxylesterase